MIGAISAPNSSLALPRKLSKNSSDLALTIVCLKNASSPQTCFVNKSLSDAYDNVCWAYTDRHARSCIVFLLPVSCYCRNLFCKDFAQMMMESYDENADLN